MRRHYEPAEELESKRQMYLDNIATKRANKESIPQAWLDGLATIEDQLENRVPGEGIASNQVFGHPQATNIQPDKYGRLVPIRATNREHVERRIKQAQGLLDELQTKWGKAQAVIAGRTKATPSQKKEAKAYLGSMNGTEDETVIELLRIETLPELNRLLRSFNPSPEIPNT
jgi:molecular chaperone GrpE (heat shock protein)